MRALLLALVIGLAGTFSVFASDDGQTQPRFNSALLSVSGTSTDIIATTNGAGNVKGVHCMYFGSAYDLEVRFYVDGGAARTVTLSAANAAFPSDANFDRYTGWIPYNVRFGSSIRVQLYKGSGTGSVSCSVSWALD